MTDDETKRLVKTIEKALKALLFCMIGLFLIVLIYTYVLFDCAGRLKQCLNP